MNGSNNPAGMLPWQQAIINAPGNFQPIPSPVAAPPAWPPPEELPNANGTTLGDQPPPWFPPAPPQPPAGPPPWTPTPPDAPPGYVPPWLAYQQANNPPPTPPTGNDLLFPPEQFAQMMANQGLVMGPGGGWVPDPNAQGLNTQGTGGTPWVPTVGAPPPPMPVPSATAWQTGSPYSQGTWTPGTVDTGSFTAPTGNAGATASGAWNPPGSPAAAGGGTVGGAAGAAIASGFTPGGAFSRTSSSLGSRMVPPSLRNNGPLGGGRMV